MFKHVPLIAWCMLLTFPQVVCACIPDVFLRQLSIIGSTCCERHITQLGAWRRTGLQLCQGAHLTCNRLVSDM